MVQAHNRHCIPFVSIRLEHRNYHDSRPKKKKKSIIPRVLRGPANKTGRDMLSLLRTNTHKSKRTLRSKARPKNRHKLTLAS